MCSPNEVDKRSSISNLRTRRAFAESTKREPACRLLGAILHLPAYEQKLKARTSSLIDARRAIPSRTPRYILLLRALARASRSVFREREALVRC